MKQLLYHIVFCCLAAVVFTACDKDDTLHATGAGADGNSIILDLASASLPVTRATVEATGVEVAVSHLDVLIFDKNGIKVWHERVSGTANKNGTITLSAKRSDFSANTAYWVYLIANSTADVNTFKADDFNLATLKGMTQEDERIHITGLQNIEGGAPQAFLMDGIAYPKGQEEPKTASAVVLNNGTEADNTELQVTLRRAAAKIVVRIKKGDYVEFGDRPRPEASQAGYYLRNMPYTTSVVPPLSMDAETAKLRTPSLYNGPYYFEWTAKVITVTSYAYAHVWDDESTLEKEVRLIVNIPLNHILRDEEGKPTGDMEYHKNSYYQIPVSKTQKLDRNTCYIVDVTLNAPGGSDPSKPVELTEIGYSVYDWENEQINVGGEDNRPAYLTLNEYEMEMHNMEEDNTTLEFVSSSEVKAEITRVYYIDKFGQEKDLEIINDRNPDEWGEKTTTGGYPQTDWKNECIIRITPDKNITGKIDVFGTVPGNNAVRYIEFTVTNQEGIKREVKVAQYPLTYITNVEGYYSYRDDFVSTASDGTSGVTTWELLAGKKINKGQAYSSAQVPYQTNSAWICGCSWNTSNNRWNYGKETTSFFGSKVVTNYNDDGLCSMRYIRWTESRRGQRTYTYNTTTANSSYDISKLDNHRMYHVTITATSSEYTLGRPRITDGKTDPGADNAVLVSPSFMLASQLGAVVGISNENAQDELDAVAEHCKQYVEVARDGTVYDDWRLPTEAEINIIYKYQNASDVMDEVLAGDRYWSASGLVTKPGVSSTNDRAIRCIRDAYDKKTGK